MISSPEQSQPMVPPAPLASTTVGRAMAVIIAGSAGVFLFLFWLVYIKPAAGYTSHVLDVLPAVNATLNAISATLLILAFLAIRRRNVALHMRLMFTALGSSSLFFISYVIYHNARGDTHFLGIGIVRPIYFSILISHIVLSGVLVPMILTSFYLSLSGRYAAHKRVSRFTMPIWLYVSVTGVLIFVMLKMFAG